MDRAVAYLPMPEKAPTLEGTELAALADPERAARVVQATDATRLERARAGPEHHASRTLANAVVSPPGAPGPSRAFMLAVYRGYPLDRRRVSPAAERELMGFASQRLALGMTICLQLAVEQRRRPWSEQVLPYGVAEMWLITPSRWPLTELSREGRLPA